MRVHNLTESHSALIDKILQEAFEGTKSEFWVFGSRVTGNARPDSDLDIAIKHPLPLRPGTLTKARAAFEESALPFEVDLVDYETASQAFKEIIDRTSIRL